LDIYRFKKTPAKTTYEPAPQPQVGVPINNNPILQVYYKETDPNMILVKVDNLPADMSQWKYHGGPAGTRAGNCYDKRGFYEFMGENSPRKTNRQMIWVLSSKKMKY
jgi:hypothetical protein